MPRLLEISEFPITRLHPQGKGGPQGFWVEDVWPTSIWRGSWFSIFKKLNIFVFTLCIWTQLWKFLIFGSYILRKTFFIFSSKKLDVVTITRYQITFWIFDFSLFDILPKYMNPKIVSRSLYALHDLPKNRGHRGRTRTDGHRFLNVCHTKALRAIRNNDRFYLYKEIPQYWSNIFRK